MPLLLDGGRRIFQRTQGRREAQIGLAGFSPCGTLVSSFGLCRQPRGFAHEAAAFRSHDDHSLLMPTLDGHLIAPNHSYLRSGGTVFGGRYRLRHCSQRKHCSDKQFKAHRQYPASGHGHAG